MKKIKLIMEQTFLLTFLIMVIMGVEGLISYLSHDPMEFDWYIPFSTILVSFLSCLPTLMFFSEKPMSKRRFGILKVIHFFLVYAIVLGAGWMFHWYSNLKYFIVISIAYLINYLLVWHFSLLLHKYEEKLINEVLGQIQDED